MTTAPLSALRYGGLGAAFCLFLLMAALLWRDRAATASRRLAVLLAIGAAAHAASASGLLDPARAPWQLPVLLLAWGSPAAFWLWARAAFDDDFTLRPWHAALWAALPLAGLWLAEAPGTAPGLARLLRVLLPYAAFGLALLAAAQTLASWRADLVAARLRLRAAVFLAAVLYIALDAWLTLSPPGRTARADLLEALALCGLALGAIWALLHAPPAARQPNPAAPPAPAPPRPPADPALLQRLDRLVRVERAYREENLTIGRLAARLRTPEHRLRQAINEGLGHRNFNAFLNAYRIEDARLALADPSQRAVPILTIAMDAGFQSIGPFNRAFKAATGLTPSEYRTARLLKSQGDSGIGQ